MRFNEAELSIATAFFWQSKNEIYLITNWHNVTGKNRDTGEHLNKETAAEPNNILVALVFEGTTVQAELKLPLFDNNERPVWYEHPVKKEVDVVAIKLPQLNAKLYPINNLPCAPIKTSIGLDAFILGYPFGINQQNLPVWKRASIASEPDIPVNNLPLFYVDTASRKGMSGAPVILRTSGNFIGECGRTQMQVNAAASKFIGIYSGRIKSGDELDTQLGRVWRSEVIEEIITNKCIRLAS